MLKLELKFYLFVGFTCLVQAVGQRSSENEKSVLFNRLFSLMPELANLADIAL